MNIQGYSGNNFLYYSSSNIIMKRILNLVLKYYSFGLGFVFVFVNFFYLMVQVLVYRNVYYFNKKVFGIVFLIIFKIMQYIVFFFRK